MQFTICPPNGCVDRKNIVNKDTLFVLFFTIYTGVTSTKAFVVNLTSPWFDSGL